MKSFSFKSEEITFKHHENYITCYRANPSEIPHVWYATDPFYFLYLL